MSSLIRKDQEPRRAVRSFVLQDFLPGKETDTGGAEGGSLLIPAGAAPSPGATPREAGGQAWATEVLERSAKHGEAELAREGYEKGFAQGHNDGLELARKEMAGKIQALERILTDLSECQGRFCLEAESQLLELSLSLAEEIIRHEVQCRPEIVRETLHAALSLVPQRTKLKVTLNPADLGTIRDILPDLEQRRGAAGAIELEGNQAVARGGCMVATECGIVDGRLEEQWKGLKERLRKILETRRRAAGGQGKKGEAS